MTWQVAGLAVGVATTLVRVGRVPGWVLVTVVALGAWAIGVVDRSAVDEAIDVLAAPIGFLLLAVPLSVLLDDVGFFSSIAALVGSGRHLRLGLWILAAGVVVLFNLDAAVVLLTPLYVRIAARHGDDPLALAFIPALMASLASSVLPVSNLTNLIVADEQGLTASDFLTNAAPAAVAAVLVGWFGFRARFPMHAGVAAVHDVVDRRALLVGLPVVVWLLVGFTVGERLGVDAWVIAAVALMALIAGTRRAPWRAVPLGPATLAVSLGVLAIAAAPDLHLERVFDIEGRPGEAAVFATAAVGSNVINNLPATVVALPSLEANPDHTWALLLGVNLGPVLWTTGALSTLLWQSTLARLGIVVTARRYAAVGVAIGVPAMLAALAVRLVVA